MKDGKHGNAKILVAVGGWNGGARRPTIVISLHNDATTRPYGRGIGRDEPAADSSRRAELLAWYAGKGRLLSEIGEVSFSAAILFGILTWALITYIAQFVK